jgi:hypothetical protein
MWQVFPDIQEILIYLSAKFWSISVIRKYLSFAEIWKNLLAVRLNLNVMRWNEIIQQI